MSVKIKGVKARKIYNSRGEETVEVEVREGRAVRISGGREAELLEESIEFGRAEPARLADESLIKRELAEAYAANADAVAEFGIGLNPEAMLTGCLLEDEKVLGTCHIAIGSNYEEDANTLIHLDGLINGPDVVAIMPGGKEREIMRGGKFVI